MYSINGKFAANLSPNHNKSLNFALQLLINMVDLMTDTKVHNEEKQGEAYSPFTNDPNQYQKKFYIESYGCAMNFSDSEIVASILNSSGFGAGVE